KPLLDRLPCEGHYFNAPIVHKRLIPAGPDHAQVAASSGIAEYFDALDAHHGGANVTGRAERVRRLVRSGENELLVDLLGYLGARRDLRVLGPLDMQSRAPTVSFVPRSIDPQDLHDRLAARGINCGAGHFYAVRLFEALGEDPARGALRL